MRPEKPVSTFTASRWNEAEPHYLGTERLIAASIDQAVQTSRLPWLQRPGYRRALIRREMPELRAQQVNLQGHPLEEGTIGVVRVGRTVSFPCRFMLVGAMNPCPCGFLGHPRKPCKCTPRQMQLYRALLSGPM